jgi:hypothetical protein
MIVNKTTKYIGQYVEFSYETPLRGLVSITSFVDGITGQTGTRLFNKEFSYTLDGVKFSKYEPLTLGALQAIAGGTIPIESDFILKFRYTRAGSDTLGNLTVDSMVINGTYSMAYLQILDLANTIFQDIGFTDEYWNKVWVNLLKKLYGKGIVANYVERGDNKEDADYITYWKIIAYYYAFTIALVDEKISKITEKIPDLSEFLIERGAYAYTDNTIVTLNLVANYIFDQIRRRATKGIIYIDGTPQAPVTNPNHGELLKLVGFKINDEFLFEYVKQLNGWYLDVNSPDYHGLYGHKQLNKWYDEGEAVDLSKLTLTGTVLNLTFFGRTNMMWMQPSSTAESGDIKVADTLGYELTFWIKTAINNVDINTLTLTISTTTALGSPVDTESILSGSVTGTILSAYTNSNQGNAIFYFIRAKIYPKGTALIASPDSQTNVNTGVNLRFKDGAERMKIKFACGAGAGAMAISDIKLYPLYQFKNNVSLDAGDMSRVWLKNRNFELSSKINPIKGMSVEEYLDIKIRETLLPFSSTLITEIL